LVVLYFLPGGLGQLVYSLRDRVLRRIADRRGILVPSLVADKREKTPEHAADETSLLRDALGAETVGQESAGHEPVGVG
jgi:hypothetical protein